jgi:HYR domain
MRIRWTAIILFVLAMPAAAGTISSINPPSIPQSTVDWVLEVYGEGLGRSVVFDGPAGRFDVPILPPNSNDAMAAPVPKEVVRTPGVYVITSGDSNAVRLQVTPEPSHQLVLLMPDPVVVEATSREGAVVRFDVIPFGGVDPNPTVSCEPASGSLFPRGPSQAQCVARNNAGERATGIVHVFVYDGAGPVVTVPDRIVVEADDASGKVVTFEARAFDSIDGELPVTCDPQSGSRFPIGITDVVCTATDSSLNPGEGRFEVEVTKGGGGGDPGTLTIQVPDTITAEATSSAGATVRFTVTASGTDDPEPMISCDPVSGSTFALGTTRVVCIATDRHGDTARGEFDVNVVDTAPPQLMLSDIFAEARSGGTAVVTYSHTAPDLVDGSVPVTCDPPSGTSFRIGETIVQCSATDSHGNTATGSFVVYVADMVEPHIASVTADPAVLAPANHKLVDVTVSVEAFDANDPMPQCRITMVTANEPIDGPGSGNTATDWVITGSLTLQLRAERSGEGTDRVYTIWVSCADLSGNESTASVDVTVPKSSGGSDKASTPPPPGKRRAVRGR